MSGPDLRTRCAGGGRICSAKDRTFGSIEVVHARRIQGAIETKTKSMHTKNKTKAQNTNRSIERIDVSGSIDRKPKEEEHPKQQGKTQAIEPLEVEAGDAAVAGMHWGWLPASVQLNRTPVEAGAACPHPPNCRERPRPNCARPIDPSTRASIEEGRIEAADRSVGRLLSLSLASRIWIYRGRPSSVCAP